MPDCPVRAITRGPEHHVFGYYDKHPTNLDDRLTLALEVPFMDRQPTPSDVATVLCIDLENGDRATPVSETAAWCWQQSAMLQWYPLEPERSIIHNIRRPDGYAARVLDVKSRADREIPWPVYTIARDGSYSLRTNFARLGDVRPGYGYDGIPDPHADEIAPADDGIWRGDLRTGREELILSFRDIVNHELEPDHRDNYKHWVNHIMINPSGTRFLFLHRFRTEPGTRVSNTRLMTCNADGTDLYLLNPYPYASHLFWKDDETVLAYAATEATGRKYIYFTDRTREIETLDLPELQADGHMSYRPQGDWFVTDTYAREDWPYRKIMLYREPDGPLVECGHFKSRRGSECPNRALRCDLHPRWSRNGRFVTFDSIHEGSRQVYRMDVSDVVGG
jgi:hypothetical protein